MNPRALALLLPAAWLLQAQAPPSPEALYVKREVRIPMRDGVELFTAIYTPREPQRPGPILVHRTPYGIGPYGPAAYPAALGPCPQLLTDGFIFVYQDVRGRMMSGGSFQEMTPHLDGRGVDEATDTYDTLQWLLEQVPHHNGKVGIWGISYPGFFAASALVGSHPALAAVSPQAPIVDLFAGDDDHHNGALFLSQAFWFAAAFGKPRPAPTPVWDWVAGFEPAHGDGYRFFLELGALPHSQERFLHGRIQSWTDLLAHDQKDAYWQARDLRPHVRDIRPAVLTVGGWFDAEDLYGTLQLHQRIQKVSPASSSCLVMGPWSHGGWSVGEGRRLGEVDFGQATARFYQEEIEAPFFRHVLLGGPDPKLPKAYVFQTGLNLWRRFAAWPPPETRPTPLYFAEKGRLQFAVPTQAEGEDAFTSDPRHPVPYTAGTERYVRPEFMAGDQRFASRRPDVLTYKAPIQEQDLTVAGPIRVHLQVSTTGSDADWVVKLIDVYPDIYLGPTPPPDGDFWEPSSELQGGYQQLVRGDVLRGKFRNSLAEAQPFAPGQPTLVTFTLNDVCHTFRAGHRVMVQVQSSWFPLVDRNPQVFMNINNARDEDFQKAEHRLFRNAAFPSWVELPILK